MLTKRSGGTFRSTPEGAKVKDLAVSSAKSLREILRVAQNDTGG